ncbi:MAG: cation diffusion facilitator family transporter [Actinomycetota bacterium]|nr:cation diffusion facilitator family transporter [Actinomycetota bacterium]
MAAHLESHVSITRRQRSRLLTCFLLVAAYFVVELVAGLATGSLSLLSDAGHMLTDAVGLGMALAAVHLSARIDATPQRSFGFYRLEILAALANGILLVGVAFFVLVEAYRRILDPVLVSATPILVVAALGLGVNAVSYLLLHTDAQSSLNMKGASLEVLADAVGSMGVLAGGIVLRVTGWPYIDPLVGAGIGLWILPRTYRIIKEALRILVQAAPPHLDAYGLEEELSQLEGVEEVHDLHLWTLSSGKEVVSAHIRVSEEADPARVMRDAQALLEGKYGLVHSTLQLETPERECRGCGW